MDSLFIKNDSIVGMIEQDPAKALIRFKATGKFAEAHHV